MEGKRKSELVLSTEKLEDVKKTRVNHLETTMKRSLRYPEPRARTHTHMVKLIGLVTSEERQAKAADNVFHKK